MEVSVDTIMEAGGPVNEWNSKQELKSCTYNGNQSRSNNPPVGRVGDDLTQDSFKGLPL